MQADESSKKAGDFAEKAGDFAEKAGGFAGEAVLGGMAVMASPVAAVASTAVISLNEMGKSLKESSSDGEITNDDVAKEVVAGGAAAGGLLLGRKLKKVSETQAKKYAPNSEVEVGGVNVSRTIRGRYTGRRGISLPRTNTRSMGIPTKRIRRGGSLR